MDFTVPSAVVQYRRAPQSLWIKPESFPANLRRPAIFLTKNEARGTTDTYGTHDTH
jgi:hypothetical protein